MFMPRNQSDESGMSLTELLVVLLIVGVLLAIAIPAYLSAQRNAQNKGATASLRVAVTAIKTVYEDKESYAFGRSELVAAEPSLDWGATDGSLVAVSDGPQKIGWTNSSTRMTLVSKSRPGICFWVRDDTVAGRSYSRAATTGGCDPSVMGGTPRESTDAWEA